jgi:protein SCO1/2
MSRASQVFVCLLLVWGQAAFAQALRLPPQPAAAFDPAIGARLPLDAVLRDETGAALRLGALFGKAPGVPAAPVAPVAPVVLVPGYYTCPNLCSTLFEGVLQALALSGMRAGSYRLVGFSIDPRDGAQAAAGKRAAYASLLPGGAADLRMLTADAHTLAKLENALGYRAPWDAASGEFAHAAGFVVADADGRITHYFPGVRFDPAALRAAVQAAREGQAGTAASLGERLLLLCSHYDPGVGKHGGAAMASVRATALLVAFGLGGWMWKKRGRP